MMGVSYHTFYSSSASLSALNTSLSTLAIKYPGKEFVIAETNWPVICPDPAAFAFPADSADIPLSVAGQTEWMQRVADVLKTVPGDAGVGMYYWKPGWVGNAALGSSCADNLMVTSSGEARSSLEVFGAI